MTAAGTGSEPLLYSLEDGVACLTLNRPEAMNAFTDEMLDRWVSRLEEARTDNAARVIVITGAGKSFCTGGDVKKMGGGEAELTPIEIKRRLREGVQRVPDLMSRIDKPIIAAINGVAVGAGMDLALACDIRFAADSARMAESYSRVGLVPGAGGAYFLPRLVGVAKALELFWSAEFIDAAEALKLGIVSRVYPDEELLERTLEFARRVAASPPMSIQLIKRAVYQSLQLDLTTSLDLVSSHQTLVRNSEDHAEAVAAMREKRPGVYRGH